MDCSSASPYHFDGMPPVLPTSDIGILTRIYGLDSSDVVVRKPKLPGTRQDEFLIPIVGAQNIVDMRRVSNIE